MDTALFALPTEKRKHPAKYTDALLVTFARMLKGRQRILDPFAGTGKVFLLNHWLPDAQIEGVEKRQPRCWEIALS
jgi:tRNA1(Val) A37 N6-methylase TrmN6